MSSAIVRTITEVVLHMTPREALYLKARMQNSAVENEPQEEEGLRASLFNALPSFDKLERCYRTQQNTPPPPPKA